MPKIPVMTFRINSKDKKALAELAKKLKVSKTQVVRLLIRGEAGNPLEKLLNKDEARALEELAKKEKRMPLFQASLLIRNALEVEGLLLPEDSDLLRRVNNSTSKDEKSNE